MYDRPNAIKGRYVKIPNMLIFVAEPVNHEVIDLWRLFNIIYIMRTSINQGRIQSLAVMIVVLINNDHPISHLLPYSRLNRPTSTHWFQLPSPRNTASEVIFPLCNGSESDNGLA